MFMSLLLRPKILAAIVLAFACLLGYLWISRLIRVNDELLTERGRMEILLQNQQSATDQALGAVEEWRGTLQRYQQNLDEYEALKPRARQEAERLDELSRNHDLEDLARARPGLVEDRINSGSDRARRMLECATGRSSSCD